MDFAYLMDDMLGRRCNGVMIDGRPARLDQPLASGNQIEILTYDTVFEPKLAWESLVNTSLARIKIQEWLQEKK
jgi:GTP pyrophosphokinase